MDRLVALCKRRGVIFPSSEIYGGIGSAYDYGPYGVEMKNNLSRHWWREMTLKHENIVGLDSAIIYNPRVWEASGHVAGFTDPMVECKECKGRFRDDELVLELARQHRGRRWTKSSQSFFEKVTDRFQIEQRTTRAQVQLRVKTEDAQLLNIPLDQVDDWNDASSNYDSDAIHVDAVNEVMKDLEFREVPCPKCNKIGALTPPRQFNLMMDVPVGADREGSARAYLRPETAQGIYIDYKIVMETSRLRPPFGIAQIGKAFRNEITTKNFIARTREFEQMEMQFFIKPGENAQWCDYWREQRWSYLMDLGVRPEKLRWHEHEKLAHYARAAWDIEYEFPYGWGELEGLHDRGDFDLSRHQEFSGKDLSFFDDQIRDRYIPHIIESSSGLNRALLMLLCEAYHEDEQAGEERIYLSLDPRIAPRKAAILPLVKKDGLYDLGYELYKGLLGRWPVFFDEAGSIGKRYRRQDEVGTPFCFTVDYQTKEDGTVTVRWRDTLQQERISKDRIAEFLFDKLGMM